MNRKESDNRPRKGIKSCIQYKATLMNKEAKCFPPARSRVNFLGLRSARNLHHIYCFFVEVLYLVLLLPISKATSKMRDCYFSLALL